MDLLNTVEPFNAKAKLNDHTQIAVIIAQKHKLTTA